MVPHCVKRRFIWPETFTPCIYTYVRQRRLVSIRVWRITGEKRFVASRLHRQHRRDEKVAQHSMHQFASISHEYGSLGDRGKFVARSRIFRSTAPLIAVQTLRGEPDSKCSLVWQCMAQTGFRFRHEYFDEALAFSASSATLPVHIGS